MTQSLLSHDIARAVESERQEQPVAAKHGEDCPQCGGCGVTFEHALDCDNDFCALAGGPNDCDGVVCVCTYEHPDPMAARVQELEAEVAGLRKDCRDIARFLWRGMLDCEREEVRHLAQGGGPVCKLIMSLIESPAPGPVTEAQR